MNKKLYLPLVIGLAGVSAMFQSCLDSDSDDTIDMLRPTAIVTVCPSADGSFVMNLDNKTTLRPNNMPESPFGQKEVRALVNFSEKTSEPTQGLREVRVNWIDSILTKRPVSAAVNCDFHLGNDPIEIVDDWVTVAEDGYLTLRVRTRWRDENIKHVLNLVTDVNPDDPFEMELSHNANGDLDGRLGDALVAFNLNGLPGFEGRVKIKLRWNSFSGPKTAEFNLPMRGCTIDDENVAKSLCKRNVK